MATSYHPIDGNLLFTHTSNLSSREPKYKGGKASLSPLAKRIAKAKTKLFSHPPGYWKKRSRQPIGEHPLNLVHLVVAHTTLKILNLRQICDLGLQNTSIWSKPCSEILIPPSTPLKTTPVAWDFLNKGKPVRVDTSSRVGPPQLTPPWRYANQCFTERLGTLVLEIAYWWKCLDPKYGNASIQSKIHWETRHSRAFLIPILWTASCFWVSKNSPQALIKS